MKRPDERVARCRGWEIGSATVDPMSEPVYYSGTHRIMGICDYLPSTDAAQAMELFDLLVADGWTVTVEMSEEWRKPLCPSKARISASKRDHSISIDNDSWKEALCEAYIRATGHLVGQ